MKVGIRSIQWRIFLYYTVLFTTAVALLAIGHFWTEWRGAQQLASLRMKDTGFQLLPFVFPTPENAPEPTPDLAKRLIRRGPVTNATFLRRVNELMKEGIYVVVANWRGEELFRSPNTPKGFFVRGAAGAPLHLVTPPGSFGVAVPSIVEDVVALGESLLSVEKETLHRLPFYAAYAILVTAGFSFLGFHLIRNALLPIRDISRTAEQIFEGNLSGRIALPEHGSELGQLAHLLNVTFERLEEMLQRQTRFLADVSHELRTPVAAILAESEFARRRERTPERYRETIEVCYQSSLHMREIIQDLLLLSRFDAGESALSTSGALKLESCDLAEIAARSLSLAHPLSREHGVSIISELTPASCWGDPKRLQHVVLNLLTNAILYNTQGGSAWIRTGSSAEGPFLEVEDTGVGIPKEKVGLVFDRFFRAEESRNHALGGSGLGLAICKTIVEAHGGRIDTSSLEGRGSTFRVTLRPVKQGEDNPSTAFQPGRS